MSKKETKKVPLKNYIILFVLVVVTVLLTLYINAWIKTYKENLYTTSPLEGKINEVNSNELTESIGEVNEVILYIGYTNDEKVYNMEKKLLNRIEDDDLKDYIIYLDITDKKDKTAYLKELAKQYGLKEKDLKTAPAFIYVKNGVGVYTVDSDSRLINSGDFTKIVETYEIGN